MDAPLRTPHPYLGWVVARSAPIDSLPNVEVYNNGSNAPLIPVWGASRLALLQQFIT